MRHLHTASELNVGMRVCVIDGDELHVGTIVHVLTNRAHFHDYDCTVEYDYQPNVRWPKCGSDLIEITEGELLSERQTGPVPFDGEVKALIDRVESEMIEELSAQVQAIVGPARTKHLLQNGTPQLQIRRLQTALLALESVNERFGPQTARQWLGGTSPATGGIAPGRALVELDINEAEALIAKAVKQFNS